MENADKFIPAELSMTPAKITYTTIPGLKNIACRIVAVNGKTNGEHHVKPIRLGLTSQKLISILSGMIEDSTVSLIDPENLLRLEYPIAIKIDSVIGAELIEDYMKDVDSYLETEAIR